MKVYIGTSGWMYPWNEGRSLDWFIENTGLNAIELNASFYRFPFPNQVKGWAKKGKNLAWAIKVNRMITHLSRFSEKSFESYKRFLELFSPLENLIHFYLFQLPPSFKPEQKEKIEEFFKNFPSKKALIEVRHSSWFGFDIEEWGEKTGVFISSVDAPPFTKKIFMVKDTIYMRFHGRDQWYSYDYSQEELKEIKDIIVSRKPENVYLFFNNNYAMLKNALEMKKIFL